MIGWIPVALAAGWIARELDPATAPVVSIVQLASLVVLLFLPGLSAVLAVASVVTLAAAVPGALVLASSGANGLPLLAVFLVFAWGAGLALGLARAVRQRSRPVS